METFSPARSQPIALSKSTEAQVYGLFAFAMGLTVVGTYIGMLFAGTLLGSGVIFALIILELVIIFTARLWQRQVPLNYLLFAAFPICSGITITPLLMTVLTGYANGASILLNALSATFFMAAAAAVFALTTKWNLSVMGRALFFPLIGLIGIGLLQFFVPAMRSTQMEVLVSAGGVIVFAGFTAYDVQRIRAMGRMGASPFLLALSLYLDIFNLFLYILRFMLILYGDRR